MSVDVTQILVQYVAKILGRRDDAAQFVGDSRGDLAAEGITDYDLSGVDMRQVISQACDQADLPYETRQALQSYTSGQSGPPSHPGNQSVNDVISHVTYATQVVYDNDEYIQQTIIDQSSDINVGGNVYGSITQDNDPVNVMAGDGGTAVSEQGEGNAAVASGAGSQAIGGDNLGVANTGAGAVIAGPGASIDGPVNTGTFTGVQADGPVQNAIVGSGNQAAQVTGNAQDAVFNFGGGHVVDVSGSPGAVTALGGDATNQIGNVVGPGGALSGSGNATGSYQDNDQDNDTTVTTTTTTTDVDTNVNTVQAQDSIVTTEQGDGDQHAQSQQQDETADA